MAIREVTITSTSAPFQQEVAVGPHRFIADEPTDLGGDDRGPTPYDLLASALGTCTSMTLMVYARRKQWPLERVVVTAHHDRVHVEDCVDCEKGTSRIERIERRIALVGPLTVEQRARLLEIADKCPVHRTLTGKLDIKTSLADPEPSPA
jgi:putative redox protein